RTTRKSQSATASKDETVDNSGPSLAPSSTNPPLLFILPKDRSIDARIVTLPNPASGTQNRYIFDPSHGLYEFTKISAPKKEPSSWLLAPGSRGDDASTVTQSMDLSGGYTLEDAGVFVATEVDPIFFILSNLLSDASQSGKQLFVTLDDHLDNVGSNSELLRDVLSSPGVLPRLDIAMSLICDKVEAGDDSMFRVSVEKLTRMLLSKAEKVVKAGLPPSMEEKFVKEALQAPTSLRTQMEMVAELEKESQEEVVQAELSHGQSQSAATNSSAGASQDSLASATSVSTTAASIADAATDTPEDEEDRRLLRLRTAFNFILASYIQGKFHDQLRAPLSKPKSPVDFAPLDKKLSEIAALKKEAQTLRSLSDNVGRKRVFEEDDEAAEARAEKKRKKEDEEAKKKAQSRAIKQLAKADTSGMKKLSSFFSK
ncbi:ribonuclease H2, subunit B, partial [Elsinoe ampelina]